MPLRSNTDARKSEAAKNARHFFSHAFCSAVRINGWQQILLYLLPFPPHDLYYIFYFSISSALRAISLFAVRSVDQPMHIAAHTARRMCSTKQDIVIYTMYTRRMYICMPERPRTQRAKYQFQSMPHSLADGRAAKQLTIHNCINGTQCYVINETHSISSGGIRSAHGYLAAR